MILEILNLIKKPVQCLFMNNDRKETIPVNPGHANLHDCTIILLFSIKQPVDVKSIEALLPVAEKHFKKVVALALFTGIQKPPPSTECVRVVSLNDYTYSGKPGSGLLENIESQKADILISMDSCESGYFKNLVRYIPVDFKAGIYQTSFMSLFHFMLQLDLQNLSEEMVLEQFVFYLKKIKTHSHD